MMKPRTPSAMKSTLRPRRKKINTKYDDWPKRHGLPVLQTVRAQLKWVAGCIANHKELAADLDAASEYVLRVVRAIE